MKHIKIKPRKGFKKITVKGKKFIYAVSGVKLYSSPLCPSRVIVYDEYNRKHELNTIRVNHDGRPTWRGKHGDADVGKYEVSLLIQQQILKD